MAVPSLQADLFPLCIDTVAQAFADSLNLLLLDNRGAPTAQRLTLPDNGLLVCLPPDCPALTPIERVWRDLKDALAWLHFPPLETPPDSSATLLRGDEAATLQSLTGYTYLVEAIHALCP